MRSVDYPARHSDRSGEHVDLLFLDTKVQTQINKRGTINITWVRQSEVGKKKGSFVIISLKCLFSCNLSLGYTSSRPHFNCADSLCLLMHACIKCALHKALAPDFKGFIKSRERLDLQSGVDALSMSVIVCVCV